jgi:hypothetical protein
LNETILAKYLKESRIFSRNELENRQVDSKYNAPVSEVFQIILKLAHQVTGAIQSAAGYFDDSAIGGVSTDGDS